MTSYKDFLSRKHFALLDGIRAFAIGAVIWHHSRGANPLDISFFNRGYLGVDLFFVLSGFLITHLLIREKRNSGTISLKKFYMRRTLRIFPLYYGFIFFLVVWAWLTNGDKVKEMFEALPYYLLYISNWAPSDVSHFFKRAWSLAVEEQFYLVWPFFVATFGFLIPARIVTAAIALSLVAAIGVLGDQALTWANKLVPYRTILLGCLVAIALNSERGFNFLSSFLNNSLAAPALFIITALVISIQTNNILGIGQLLVHICMALFLVACVLCERNPIRYLLQPKIVQKIGQVSYGMYILHGQFWGLTLKIVSFIPIAGIHNSRITFSIVFTAITFAAALVSYHTLERFFLNLKKRFNS